MKELIPMNEHGIFADMKDTARLDSRFVAETFEKQHKNVLRDIEQIIAPDSGWSEEFGRLNFELSSYTNSQNKKQLSRFNSAWGGQVNVSCGLM